MTRIAVITPYYEPAVRGNAVTVSRIARHTARQGDCETRVFSLDTSTAEEIGAAMHSFRPDLIHAFHGYHGGRVARLSARVERVPYIVTLTGTDLYQEAAFPEEELREVFLEAAALVTFDASMKRRVASRWPEFEAKVRIIPQGVDLPKETSPGREDLNPPEGEFMFFLPAGLRPVKDVLMPLPPLAELHHREPGLRLILAGPVLDAEYARLVLAHIERHPFVQYLGEVRHEQMAHLFRRADVVLCTSLFEGGMANSLIEAMAVGKPVLASAIDGNLSLIREGETGLLFADEREFLTKAERLLRDPSLRQRIGEAGRRYIEITCSAEREAASYCGLYRLVSCPAFGRSDR